MVVFMIVRERRGCATLLRMATNVKPGDRVRRGDVTGKVTRVSRAGGFLMVKVGRGNQAVMRVWPTAEAQSA